MAKATTLDTTYLNACVLCTHRPAAVTVEDSVLDSETLLSTVRFRQGPQGKGKRHALAWEALCGGCHQDLSRSLDALPLPATEEELDAPRLVTLDWAALVLGLRD